jgi:hypothetical protein
MPRFVSLEQYVPTRVSTSLFRLLLPTVVLASGSLAAQTFPARFAPMAVAADGRGAARYSSADPRPTRTTLHRQIRTSVPLASRAFDAGLTAHYAYRHSEAVRMFREAQRLDPRCVMCLVGEAIALGPAIDARMSPESDAESRSAIRKAMQLVPYGEDGFGESAWVRAVATRYIGHAGASRAELDSAYAGAMRRLSNENPRDADAATLAAEAMMILSPYAYWSATGTPLRGTRAIVMRLDQALRAAPGHVGACNFYVHVMEAVDPAASCVARKSAPD